MLKRVLRKLIFPVSLLAVLGLLALYIAWSGESHKVSPGTYSPEQAKAFFAQLTFQKGTPSGQTLQAGGNTWYKAAEGNGQSLWMEPTRGLIAVTDKNGKMWMSNPSDEDMAKDKVQGLWRSNLASPLLFRYLKGKDGTPELTNLVDHKAQVEWRTIPNGIGFHYAVTDLGFDFYAEYRLTENGFELHIPEQGILESKENRLVTLEALPFFGAGAPDANGYLFVPDGPGGLIKFNQQRSSLVTAYDQPVYGYDYSIPPLGQTFPRAVVSYPVFGLKNGDSGFLAIIERGQYKANVYATPAGIQTAFNNVYAKFNLRRPYKQPTGLKKSVDTYEANLGAEEIQVRFEMLGKDRSDYVGMAKTYRSYLQQHGVAKLQDKTGKPPLYLDFIMAATEPGQVSDKTVVATTFDQVGDIVDELNGQGIDRLEIGVGGWSPGGFQGSLPKRFPIESKVGGLSGLTKLAEELQKKNIPLSMQDVFTQATNKLGNGFSPLKDAARIVDGTAFKGMNAGDWYSKETYFYRPSATNMKDTLDKALEEYKKLPIDGIGLLELGSIVYSDYSQSRPMTRQQTVDIYQQMLDETRATGRSVTTSGANSYVLGHVDHIQGLPIAFNYDLLIDEEVPFYPIAVHGLVTYSGNPANVRTEPVAEYLRAIEYGAVPFYALTDVDPRELKRTTYAYLFSSKFSVLEPAIVKEYGEFVRASEGVWGSFIENHRKVSDGVYETTYENGRKIWVNYNLEPYQSAGHKVEAQSFAVIEQGVSR